MNMLYRSKIKQQEYADVALIIEMASFVFFTGTATLICAIRWWMHRQSTLAFGGKILFAHLRLALVYYGLRFQLLLLQSQRCSLLEVWNPTETEPWVQRPFITFRALYRPSFACHGLNERWRCSKPLASYWPCPKLSFEIEWWNLSSSVLKLGSKNC